MQGLDWWRPCVMYTVYCMQFIQFAVWNNLSINLRMYWTQPTETVSPDEGPTCTLVREGTRRMTKPSSVHQLKSSHEPQEGLYTTADRLIVSRKVASTFNSNRTPTHSNQIGRKVTDSYPALTVHCRRMRSHIPVACARSDYSQIRKFFCDVNCFC